LQKPSGQVLVRRQNEARKVVAERYQFRCCVICGIQIETCLTVAHLDQDPSNNDPGNLALMCQTHHWMFDSALYPIEAIKMLREHWQETKGVPNHKPRMKIAGIKAAYTKMRSAAARKANATRRARRDNSADAT
jgi:hypothetical protein